MKYVKYPRTHHVSWSPGVNKDDRVLHDLSHFNGQQIIVTAKMDGENTTMYSDYIHARSIDSNNHDSRNWVKNLHSKIAYNIPEGWRVCGENLYAKHSIFYENLISYFLVFSIWDEYNSCLSWNDTVEWSKLLGLNIVPILFEGIYDEQKIKSLCSNFFQGNELEGYVLRLADSFSYRDFKKYNVKYVRQNHVQTYGHWSHRIINVNKLK